jgi:phosphopantetheinyl transferase (holo-ACP synthase)
MGLQRLELLNDARGAPMVVAHGELAEHLEREGLVVHVSLSDEQSMAQAFAVVEKR